MKKRAPLWITGMGCLSAAGVGLSQTRQTLFAAAASPSNLAEVGEFSHAKVHLPPLPEVGAGDAGFYGLTSLSSRADRYAPNQLALHAVAEALQMAGLDAATLARLRVGVCIGSTVGGTNYQPDFNRAYFKDELPSADCFFDYFENNTAQFLARHHQWSGPVQLINNACTSGADTLGISAGWLDRDVCDVVVCGGIETILPKMCHGFRSLRLYSPTTCKPFDRQRQGLVLGDGAGVIVLEKSNSKRAAIAHLLGYGAGSDAYHPTSPHPEARGLNLAVRSCLMQSGLEMEQIDFINAHATATPHNDLAEGGWIKKRMPETPVVATKGYTGHTLAAAGSLEAIFSILSLLDQRLPASRGFQEMDPEIGLQPTTRVTRAGEAGVRRELNNAISFSLGFGGSNVAVCLGRAT